MRTIRLKEAAGVTMQQLIAMSDDEVSILAGQHERKPYYPPESAFKIVNGIEESIDIRKTYRSASRQDRGVRPYGGLTKLLK